MKPSRDPSAPGDPPRAGNSLRAVEDALRRHGPLGPAALAARAGLSPRTLRYAVARLRALGRVGARASVEDGRRIEYFLRDDA